MLTYQPHRPPNQPKTGISRSGNIAPASLPKTANSTLSAYCEGTGHAIRKTTQGVTAINNDVDRSDPVQTSETAENGTDEAAGDSFLQRRLDHTQGLLDAALRDNRQMARKIRDLEMGQLPPEVEHAMTVRSARMRPLHVVVDGKPHVLAIPARGIRDPVVRQRIWRTLHERYGSQEQ